MLPAALVFVLLSPLIVLTIAQEYDSVVYNLRTNQELNHTWLEIGFTFLDDQNWLEITTKETDLNPNNDTNVAVFISLPEYGGDTYNDGFPLVPKLQGRATKLETGEYSFTAKLVQANDSACSKEWFIPQFITEVQVSWMIAEEGLYNFSDHLFIINSDEITRNNSVEVQNDYPLLLHHVEHFDYPHAAGCNSSTPDAPCSFSAFAQNASNLKHLGAIQQIQTSNNVKEEGKDLWLTIRARDIGDAKSQFVIVTHDSNRTLFPDYESIHTPEIFAYFIFETDLDFVCIENLLFETKVDFDVSSVGKLMDFSFDYAYAPGLYGMLGTIRSLRDSTSLRAYNRSKTSTNYITQEDQCLKEDWQHTTKETTYSLVAGEAVVDVVDHTLTRCFVRFSSGWIPTGSPTGPPSGEPSSCPSVRPSSAPSTVPSSEPSGAPSVLPSGEPSTIPSVIPSGEPSSVPSGKPSGVPSSMPSSAPSGLPSGKPSAVPSGEPSGSPTTAPSSVPSGKPSAVPSMVPSSVPSSIPSEEPTGLPSLAPTAIPSACPSANPTSEPSACPSGLPSIVSTRSPSATPSGDPSGEPSVLPSIAPTAIPSACPSANPTSEPSAGPSGKPTSEPTAEPSSEPTGTPSSCPSALPSSTPSGLPSGVPSACPSGAPSRSPTGSPTGFPTGAPTREPSSCPSSFPSGMPTGLPTAVPSGLPSGEPSSRPSNLPSGMPTGLPSAVPSAVPSGVPSGMPSGVPSAVPSTAPSSCPSNIPSGEPTAAPSGGPSSSPSGAPSGEPTFAPTNSDMFFSRSPQFKQLSCRPASNGSQAIVVQYEMKEGGRIACAAFEGEEMPVLSTVRTISAVAGMGQSGVAAVHFTAGYWDMTLGGLKGDVAYQVLCFSESFLNFPGVITTTELVNVYNMSCNATVPSPKSAVLSVAEVEDGSGATVVRGSVSNLMQVSLSSLPSNKVTFTPVAFSYPFDSGLDKVRCLPPDVSSMDVSNQDSFTAFFPPNITFDSSSTNLISRFYFNTTSESECLFVTLVKSEVSKDEFETTTDSPHGLQNVTVVDGAEKHRQNFVSFFVSDPRRSSFEFDIPIVFSAGFDETGMKLILEYNYETDRGSSYNLSSGTFDCSVMILSTWASKSLCEFTSMRHVTVSLPAHVESTGLPIGGDEISLVGGKVKTKCHKSVLVCRDHYDSYPWEEASTVEINAPRPGLVRVVPSIVSSHVLSACHVGMPIDISMSTGSAGRPWEKLTWSVIGPGGDNSSDTLAAYLNSNIDWSTSSSINSATSPMLPESLFSSYGVYTLVLYLENVFGTSAYGTFSVEHLAMSSNMTGGLLSVLTLDSHSRVTTVWDSLTSQMAVRVSDHLRPNCSWEGSIPLDNVSFAWDVFMTDDLSVTSTATENIARDPLKFITQASSLLAENEYTFRFAGSSGASLNLLGSNFYDLSPFGETRVYVEKGTTVAKIGGGKFRTIYGGVDLLLDASTSFDQSVPTVMGASSGLKFEWRCFVISPVLSHECVGFSSGNSPTASIASGDIESGAVYSITLDVMDQDGLRQSFAQTKVGVTGHSASLVTLPSEVTMASISQDKFDITTVLQPQVNDNATFSVSWGIDELDTFRKHSKSYFRPGAIASEYSLFPSTLSSGAAYSLSLSIDSFPDCASNCLGGKFTLAVLTNFAPSGGSFSVYPLRGVSLRTDFHMSAPSWVDEDLPLQYSFFQSVGCDADSFALLHQKSSLSWAWTVLKEGCNSSSAFDTITQVKVTDSYGSSIVRSSSAMVVTAGDVSPVSSKLSVVEEKVEVARHELDQNPKLQILNVGFFGDEANESEVSSHVIFSLSLNSEIANAVEYDFDVFSSLVQSFRRDVALLKQSSMGYSYLTDPAMLEAVITSVNTLNAFASNTETAGRDLSLHSPNSEFLSGLSELFSLYNSAAQQSSSRRSLQGGLFTIDVLLPTVITASTNINDNLFGQVAIGESSVEEFDGFYVRSSKVLFVELDSDTFAVTPDDNVTMLSLLDSASPSGTGLTYGVSSIQYKDEFASVCEDNSVVPCEVQYPTLSAVSYISVLRSTAWSQVSEFNLHSDLPLTDMPSKRTATSSSEDCEGDLTPTVPFDCSTDTVWGSLYSSAVSCANADNSSLRYGTWDMTCPVYNTSVACSSDVSSSCQLVAVSLGVTVCSCESDFTVAPAGTGSTGLMIGSAGYTMFRTEVSNNPVYEVAVVEAPVFVFATPMPSSEPSSIPSSIPSSMPSSEPSSVPTSMPSALPTMAPVAAIAPKQTIIGGVDGQNFWILILLVVLLLLLFLICWLCFGRRKANFWLPWFEVNTDPSWVLRELIDEAYCTFDDDDFTDMLLELDKPFEEECNMENPLDKSNLTRDYPLLRGGKSTWQEQNVNASSLGLDAVDYRREGIGKKNNFSELMGELNKPFPNEAKSQLKLSDILLSVTPLTAQEEQDWIDINDSMHPWWIRDDVDELKHYNAGIEDMLFELGYGIDQPEGWADINDSFHELLIRDEVSGDLRNASFADMAEELKMEFPVVNELTEQERSAIVQSLQDSALTLQCAWRVKRAIGTTAALRRRRKAALSIQAAWRGKSPRQQFTRKKHMAITLQKLWRGAMTRKRFVVVKEAASILHRWARGCMSRGVFRQLFRAHHPHTLVVRIRDASDINTGDVESSDATIRVTNLETVHPHDKPTAREPFACPLDMDVKLRVASQYKTNIVPHTLTPHWNEDALLTGVKSESIIVLSMYGAHIHILNEDAFLGQNSLCVHDIDDLYSGKSVTFENTKIEDFKYPVFDSSGKPMTLTGQGQMKGKGFLTFSVRLLSLSHSMSGWLHKASTTFITHSVKYVSRWVVLHDYAIHFYENPYHMNTCKGSLLCRDIVSVTYESDEYFTLHCADEKKSWKFAFTSDGSNGDPVVNNMWLRKIIRSCPRVRDPASMAILGLPQSLWQKRDVDDISHGIPPTLDAARNGYVNNVFTNDKRYL